jgi:hypothetical protein
MAGSALAGWVPSEAIFCLHDGLRKNRPSAADLLPGSSHPHGMLGHEVLPFGASGLSNQTRPEIPLELVCRERGGIKEALCLFAALMAQERRLHLGFDSLGNDGEAEIVCHCNERAHDGGVLRFLGDLSHEAAVDLDSGQG